LGLRRSLSLCPSASSRPGRAGGGNGRKLEAAWSYLGRRIIGILEQELRFGAEHGTQRKRDLVCVMLTHPIDEELAGQSITALPPSTDPSRMGLNQVSNVCLFTSVATDARKFDQI
jgi:hypothetical protein